MFSDILSFDGMKGFLILSEIWYYLCESWNLISGYDRTDIYMNILMYTSMT